MLRAYRRIVTDNPDNYLSAIADVFARYHPDIVNEATGANGVQFSDKFKVVPPNAGEVKEFCEAIKKRHEATDAVRAAAEKRGDVVVLPSSQNYEKLKAEALTRNNGSPYYDRPWLDPEGVLWSPKTAVK